MTLSRLTAVIVATVVVSCCSGCMGTLARSGPPGERYFQPMLGTRSSLYMIGQCAQTSLLHLDEDGEEASWEDAGLSLIMAPMFVADIPLTIGVDVLNLPMDIMTEIDKRKSRDEVLLTQDSSDDSDPTTDIDVLQVGFEQSDNREASLYDWSEFRPHVAFGSQELPEQLQP